MTIKTMILIVFSLASASSFAAEIVPEKLSRSSIPVHMATPGTVQLRFDEISTPISEAPRAALEASGGCLLCGQRVRLAFNSITTLGKGILEATGAYTPPKTDASAPAGGDRCTIQRGEASYYGRGDGFAGRRTANGERMNPNANTAAHRTASFGSMVTVKNLKNGKSVTVRVNDRGPYARGRVIDVAYAAAVEIGLDRSGHAPVEIRICPAKASS